MSVPFIKYPPFGEEDTEYAYAVGRVRALETQLLDNARIERMMDSEDPGELLRILQDTVYGQHISELSDPSDFERMLKKESARAFSVF
jgi:V/A-type H+-transporting ATPase subunit C